MERQMIVILPTGTGFIVGTAPVGVPRTRKSSRKADLVRGLGYRPIASNTALNKLQRWLRRTRMSN